MTAERRSARADPGTPADVVREFLDGAFDPDRITDVADRFVADDAVYVSLDYDDAELKRIMPWAGTKRGRSAFVDDFTGVTTRWTREAFRLTDAVEQDEKVAPFGAGGRWTIAADPAGDRFEIRPVPRPTRQLSGDTRQ